MVNYSWMESREEAWESTPLGDWNGNLTFAADHSVSLELAIVLYVAGRKFILPTKVVLWKKRYEWTSHDT